MWNDLLPENKKEYKKMILAFTSLTEMFAQKEDISEKEIDKKNKNVPAPIINSKYQETIFQRVFGAVGEDINNKSYDASLVNPRTSEKYLIGIKTFRINSGDQKIAQFKTNHDEWEELINKIKKNSVNPEGKLKSKEEIFEANKDLYLELARKIAIVRNKRIDSSISNLRGFRTIDNETFESVYHVLMPSKKGEPPAIYVGETSYDRIDIDKITTDGCTSASNPTNFKFTDGKHQYKYTSADSQLLMNFENDNIVLEKWDIKYADDAYAIFKNIADDVYSDPKSHLDIEESYSWMITNSKGEVERFSGFNSFYGVGSKLGMSQRNTKIDRLLSEYRGIIDNNILKSIAENTRKFLIEESSCANRQDKIDLRDKIMSELDSVDNIEFQKSIKSLLYRPSDEIYIPLPQSKSFHSLHPDFFAPGLGRHKNLKNIKQIPKENRRFTLVFEPSGEKMESYITQENGKAIESWEKQTILGDWILRKVFQLGNYEPLTAEKLDEVGLNGIRLYKIRGSPDVHL